MLLVSVQREQATLVVEKAHAPTAANFCASA